MSGSRFLSEAVRLATRARDIAAEDGIAGVVHRARERIARARRDNYGLWRSLYDQLTEHDLSQMRERADAFKLRPTISFVMPTYQTPERFLREAIESVISQTYGKWELCIVDDASPDDSIREVLAYYADKEPRIRVQLRGANGHISRATNDAIALSAGEWVAFLDHDDLVAPHALFCVVEALNRHPQAQLIYSDEDKITARGRRFGHYFKTDWNPELFRSHNMMTHLSVYRRDLIESVGGLRVGFEGAQDYDLGLRCIERLTREEIVHVPIVLYHWRSAPGSTALASAEKPYAMAAGERALQEHLERTGRKGRARLIGFGYRIEYDLPAPPPRVSIIIPTRNGLHLLRRCLQSIWLRSTYPDYEVIVVDNGSDDATTITYLAEEEAGGRLQVIRDSRPFNYSALNNAAAAIASGTVLVLLNNDTEVISPGWLEEMVSLAMQPGTGAVGAKLCYANDTLQHAGVVMGLGGLAAHAFEKFHRSSRGYNGRAALRSNFSALTGACLAVRKDHFFDVGGLDEALPIAYNDIDFCLKLDAAGLRNVWTPFAELYHHESQTRGAEDTPEKQARQKREGDLIRLRWAAKIHHDPAYSPNLTLDRADFTLAHPPRVVAPWKR